MKILCPVGSPGEAAALAALGAEEFYGGLLSKEWEERFTLAASANRRSFPEAQIAGERELGLVVEAAHGAGAKFYLAVNSPFYTAEQAGPLARIVGGAVALGVDALICADIGLIAEARERWPGTPVHLSTMAEASNSAAVAFYRRLGVGRVTLPRHLALGRIEDVVRSSPGVKFDAFVLFGQCANDEGHCTFSHDDPQRVWPCVQSCSVSAAGSPAGPPSPAVAGQAIWKAVPRGEACGLCGLWDLHRLGVEGLKIVGRGTSLERKQWAVGTVARLVAAIEGGVGRAEFLAEARRLYRERFPRGCRPALCYFPELIEGGRG